jgi:hypothetical protein
MDSVIIPYVVLCAASLVVAGLTLFSGFGLGTLLMPVFALFFSIETAVAVTALVHLANNLFKLGIVGRHADRRVSFRVAIPAAVTAPAGALLLTHLSGLPMLATYRIGTRVVQVMPVSLVVGLLIVVFALVELVPALGSRLRLKPKFLVLGGALSGFFGGLSGHQGALRSMVLLRCGLTKEAFIATGVICAVVVDVSRLVAYGAAVFEGHFDTLVEDGNLMLIIVATLSAFVGSFVGTRWLKRVTMHLVQSAVGVMLLVLGCGLASGLL